MTAPIYGLSAGEQLSLVAGDVEITGDGDAERSGATIRIEQGRLFIAASEALAVVEPEKSAAEGGGNIAITGVSVIDLAGDGGGSLILRGGEVSIGGGSDIELTNLGARDAGRAFDVSARRFSVDGGARINAGTVAEGRGGDAGISAQNVRIAGTSADRGGIFSTSNFGPVYVENYGAGGRVDVLAERLEIGPGGNLSVAGGFFAGDAGEIAVRADELFIDGGNLEVLTGLFAGTAYGGGQGGIIRVDSSLTELRRGGQISASNGGARTGGDIYIDAGTLNAVGNANDAISGVFSSSLSYGTAGNIIISGGNLNLQGNALVASDALDAGSAGRIDVTVQNVDLRGSALTTTGISSKSIDAATGRAGDIRIHSAGHLSISGGASITSSSRADASIDPPDIGGDGGDITVDAKTVRIAGTGEKASGIFSDIANKPGNGGRISVNADSVELLNGGQISSKTIFGGDAGAVDIQTNQLVISGDGIGLITTGITTNSQYQGGLGGRIDIAADALSIVNGGVIQSNTAGYLAAGSIGITGREIDITGDSSGVLTGITSTSQAFAYGDGGRVDITTEILNLSGGAQISSDTFGYGKAGSIHINAKTVTAIGGDFPSAISSRAAEFSEGDAGSVSIQTDQLSLFNGGLIRTSSLGSGKAGNIDLETRRIDFADATVRTDGNSAEGGRIRVRATELINVRDVQITTNGILADDGASIIDLDAPLLALNRSSILSLIEDIELTPEAFKFLDDISTGEANLLAGTSLVSIDTIVAATTNADVTGVLNDVDSSLQLTDTKLIDTSGLLNRSCFVRSGSATSTFATSGTGLTTDPTATLPATVPKLSALEEC